MLGYPDHMIDSYCYHFHSDLSQEEKESETRRAREYTIRYFRNASRDKKVERVEIKLGNDKNILEDGYIAEYLSNFVV